MPALRACGGYSGGVTLGTFVRSRLPSFAEATKHLNFRQLDGGTEGNHGFGSCAREASSQIPAKAGTTIRALACFKSGVLRGFRNGLLRSREANPELPTIETCIID